jgi:hypothetical protein
MPEKDYISAVRGYLRLGNFPLDASSVYDSFQAASEYADSNPTAYPGQLIAVVQGRTVTIYQLGYKLDEEEIGFELQPLSTAGEGPIVRTINEIEPDINGNIDINLQFLDELLTFLENTNDRVIFNKPVSVPTESISQRDDVITKGYLEALFSESFSGISRTLKTSFSYEGGSTLDIIPGGIIIKKIVVKVTEAFQPAADITISIDGVNLFTPEDIFETSTGIHVLEPFLTLTGTSNQRFPVLVTVTGDNRTAGFAEIYIDFNINFTV